MGNLLQSTQKSKSVVSKSREELLISGYIREIYQRKRLIPFDLYELILLYSHQASQSIVSFNGELQIINSDEENTINYAEGIMKNRFHRRDVIYERKIGIIHYDLIPYSTKQRLLSLINPLQNKKNNFRDAETFIHQHSKNEHDPIHNLQIQDLIDPYNNVYHYKSNQIHWIPTVFEKLKRDKKFKIVSEINDLPSKEYGDLYPVIEDVFNAFIPLFNDIMFDPQSIAKKKAFNPEYTIKSICEQRRLFVIIKMQNYIFNGNYEYEAGWHKEGYDDEHIEAVGIYYFDIQNGEYLEINDLELRCITGLEDKANGCLKYWRRFGNENIETVENMCIVFKNNPLYGRFRVLDGNENIVLHKPHLKVNGMNLNTPCVSRKILCFFLVDPMRGNDIWWEDTTKEMIQNVNKNAISLTEYNSNRMRKNGPNHGAFQMKPPSWIGDDPLTRMVYAGMGD